MSETITLKGEFGRTRRYLHAALRIFANDETEVSYPAGTICRVTGKEDGKLRVVVNEDAILLIDPNDFSPGLGRIAPHESFSERRQRNEEARTRNLLVARLGAEVLEVLERADWKPPEEYES